MMDALEIRHSRFAHNMDAWCVEKSSSVLESAAGVIDRLRASDVPSELRDELLALLRIAVHDGTKLYAFGMGAVWQWPDSQLVWSDGSKGLGILTARYGVRQPVTSRQMAAAEVIYQIEELLSGPRAPARTLIFDLLQLNVLQPTLQATLLALNDNLREGLIGWDEYVGESRRVIEFRRPRFAKDA